MSEISLKWFFQIPGLFITIGVLLILIALLVLIIGSSRARGKKLEENGTESSSLSEDVVAKSNEIVNVIGNVDEKVLDGNVTDITGDNSSPLNDLTDNIEVNNDNIMPVTENFSSIVTPVNVNENSIEKPVVNLSENIVEKKVLETIDMNEVNPMISEPVIKKVNSQVQETLDEINNNTNSNYNESTVAPFFSKPSFGYSNTSFSDNQRLKNPVEITPSEQLIKPLDEVVLENNNVIGQDFESPIKSVIPTEPIVEPIVPPVLKVDDIGVPSNDNNALENITIPNLDNQTVVKTTTENTEIEEIL